jgi:hypothetical protein
MLGFGRTGTVNDKAECGQEQSYSEVTDSGRSMRCRLNADAQGVDCSSPTIAPGLSVR